MVMAEHAVTPRKRQKKAAVKKAAAKKATVKKATAKKAAVKKPAAKAAAEKGIPKTAATIEEECGAKIVVLTDDPRRRVVIVPGCHLDSLRQEKNVYFFEDGNALIGMIVQGGTVEYHPGDRAYVVRLTDGQHGARS